jgi:Flp pilus assembly protein TadD
LSRHNDPAILDSLAAAYAEAGRFDDARSTAQQAIELANRQGNVPLAALLRGRIALYEHGQPYREEDITLAPTSPPFP